MNQDNNNNQTTALLVKISLTIQVLTLILIACFYFGSDKQRTEYQNQMTVYREKAAEHQKSIEEYQRQMADYKLQSDKYQEDVAAWKKSMLGYTNSAIQSLKQ
jgi:uncharacterized coiled-coil DUF342 family protein